MKTTVMLALCSLQKKTSTVLLSLWKLIRHQTAWLSTLAYRDRNTATVSMTHRPFFITPTGLFAMPSTSEVFVMKFLDLIFSRKSSMTSEVSAIVREVNSPVVGRDDYNYSASAAESLGERSTSEEESYWEDMGL